MGGGGDGCKLRGEFREVNPERRFWGPGRLKRKAEEMLVVLGEELMTMVVSWLPLLVYVVLSDSGYRFSMCLRFWLCV